MGTPKLGVAVVPGGPKMPVLGYVALGPNKVLVPAPAPGYPVFG